MYNPDEKVLRMIADMDLRLYFLFFASTMDPFLNLEELTGLFSDKPYTEEGVHGNTWRQLRPREKRFDRIDLIYNHQRQVKCIRWFSSFELAGLIDIFGMPFLASSYPGEGEMTAFIFPGNNKYLTIGSLIPAYIDENILEIDPTFNPRLLYVEFRISDPDEDESLQNDRNPGTLLN